MDRIAQLVVASTALRRRIWASLPFSIRIADFFSRLASTGTDAFGKVMFGVFLRRGVTGLPDIHGKPALEVQAAAGGKDITNRLPSAYGREFGTKCFKLLMSKVHNPATAEDLMSEFAVKFLEGGYRHLDEGSSLKDAQNFVMRSLQNQSIDWMRKKKEVSDMMSGGDDDAPMSRYDITPTFDETSLEDLIKERLPSQVRSKLHAIHPSAEQYVMLVADGHGDREIFGDPDRGIPSLLDDPYTKTGKPLDEKNWRDYKLAIFKILKRQFADLHQPHAHP